MSSVLITGANGFIGRALCRKMLAEGWHVRGVIRNQAGKTVLPREVETIEIGAIDAETEWGGLLESIDAVVHLAARVHFMKDNSTDPLSEFRNIDVAGTQHLAQMAANKKVKRFVFLSSIKVNGEGRDYPYSSEDPPAPVDPYAISKYEAEQVLHCIARDQNIEVTILRPPLVYGPGVKANFLKLMKIINLGIPLPFASVQNQRSMIYIENLIDAIFLCTVDPEAAGKTYLISDGTEISTPELIQKISVALGKSCRLFPVPPSVLRILAKLTGQSETVDRLLSPLFVDASQINSELDWVPPYSMEEGLDQTAKWYLNSLR